MDPRAKSKGKNLGLLYLKGGAAALGLTETDGIMLDLEDSATPANKEGVRNRVIEVLGDMSYFGGRHVIVRYPPRRPALVVGRNIGRHLLLRCSH